MHDLHRLRYENIVVKLFARVIIVSSLSQGFLICHGGRVYLDHWDREKYRMHIEVDLRLYAIDHYLVHSRDCRQGLTSFGGASQTQVGPSGYPKAHR